MASSRHQAAQGPAPLLWAREACLIVIGAVLGLALVVGLTDELGRRVCGVVASIPGAAILFGCDR